MISAAWASLGAGGRLILHSMPCSTAAPASSNRRRRAPDDEPMKLQHIANGSQDTPLIRLYDFGRADAFMLHRVVDDLTFGRRNQVPLHEVDGIEPVGACRLTLAVGGRNEGVIEGPGGFTCTLTREAWGHIAYLIEPFCERAEPGFFQYLDQTSSITLLLSVDGGW